MSILNSILKVFLGDKSGKDLRKITPLADKINDYYISFEKMSNDSLRDKTNSFKKKIFDNTSKTRNNIDELNKKIINESSFIEKEKLFQEVETLELELKNIKRNMLNEILPEAFAVIKETARRFVENTEIEVKATDFDKKISSTKSYVKVESEKATWINSWDAAGKNILWDMIHYDVQLIGGIVLHQGKIAEMQTGEGKTVVSTLPVYLNALTGDGVHLVTVNDYLARRDSAWMGPIFEFHGLSVECIDDYKPNSPERKRAYEADITYGTNNEFGFDYLRDNMSHNLDDIVQRRHNYAIVDEVDSVLIDDARTPLIISGPTKEENRQEFDNLKPKIQKLVSLQKTYLSSILAESKKLIEDSNNEDGGFLLYRVFRGLPKTKALIKFLSEEGIKQILQKNENFFMQDNNREMPQIDKELYFTIDEKINQIDLTDKGIETISTDLDDKDFFVLPDIATAIATIEKKGLSKEDEVEGKNKLFQDFNIKSERIHTLNQLLTEMDGFGTNSGVIVMAATNRADVLDKALTRAGRFDRQIFVDLPDLLERKKIFEVHLKPIKLVENMDVNFLARQTPGFSGTDIANVCNEAALIAARKENKEVGKQDFLDAVDRIIGGLEKKSKIISPNEKKTIAFHEAGHATVSWMLQYASPLIKVTIVPRGKSLGAAWYLPEERQLTTTEQMLDEICAAMGGRAAEEVFFGKISTGALSDLEKVTKMAYAMVSVYGMNNKVGNRSYYDSSGQDYSFTKPYSEATAKVIDEEVSKLIEKAYTRAKSILDKHKKQLMELAYPIFWTLRNIQ